MDAQKKVLLASLEQSKAAVAAAEEKVKAAVKKIALHERQATFLREGGDHFGLRNRGNTCYINALVQACSAKRAICVRGTAHPPLFSFF